VFQTGFLSVVVATVILALLILPIKRMMRGVR
jgi:hypothetical protein